MYRKSLILNFRHLLITFCFLAGASNTYAQTFVTGPLTSTPAAGEYYNNSTITLSPNFSFAASSGQSLHLYILSPDCVPLSTGLSSTQNYVATYMPRSEGIANPSDPNNTTCQVMATVQYLDGLGRLSQTIQIKGSPSLKDVIQPVVYDNYGRETTKYLPYTNAGTSGSYRPTAITDQLSFYTQAGQDYKTINSPFSQAILENSPLNRPLEQGVTGDTWQPAASRTTTAGRTVITDYSVNATSEVSLWGYNSNGAATSTSYVAGSLYKTVSKDENWTSGKTGTVEQFKDFEGHVVLKRIWQSESNSLSTYYVYNDFGNLAYVIPPGVTEASFTEVATDADFSNFIYGYHYDERNRVIEKKLPGKGWESLVYNTLDQVIATQDGLQAGNSQWLYTKYDALGRMVSTGIWNAAISRASLQANINSNAYGTTTLWEAPSGSDYTNTAWPLSSTTPLTVNYYDNYIAIAGLSYTSQVIGTLTNPTGMLTATKTAVLNNPSDMLWQVNYYDDKSRTVETYKQHYLGGVQSNNNYDETTITYDFTNEVVASTRKHYINSGGSPVLALTLPNTYNYDHMGRKTQTHELLGGVDVLLSQSDYNEIGQLKTKHLHSVGGSSFLQDINYSYNERGWLKTSSAPLFAMQLNYEDGAHAQYNGNIADQYWGTPGNLSKNYIYQYDPLNRLTDGTGGNGFNGYSETGISYDNMGNILTLNRAGGANTASLSYNSYIGNQLQSVTNSGSAFRTYGTYDANGNAPTDGQGNTITYNLLNLPASIPGKSLTYTYDAAGAKLRKVSGPTTTEYIDGIQYTGTTMDFVQTEEGRILNPTGTPNYEYTLTDHLGNSRVSFDSSHGGSTALQTEDYYPFGLIASQPYVTSPPNHYLYNRKELQDELTQYDYGARFYDPVIGRWTSVDPLAEKYCAVSGYNYGINNPVRFHDPNGMGPNDWVKIGNSFKFDRKIHNDAEAQSKYGLGAIDVTANGQSYIYTGSNDMTVRLYSGDLKHWEYVSPYMTFDTKQEKNQGQDQDIGNGIEIADKINTGAGLVNSVHAVGVAGAMKNAGVTNETLSESEEFGKGFKAFKNATRTIGVVTTGVDAGIAAYDFYQHPTTGNFIKLGVKGALFGLEAFELTNPYIGLGISILDATGVTKKGYDWIDHNTLGSAGSIENYNKKQLDGTHLSL